MKWLILALILTLSAIIVMVIGLLRYKKIANAAAETDEAKEENLKKGQKVFFKYTVISTALIIIAIIIRLVIGKVVV